MRIAKMIESGCVQFGNGDGWQSEWPTEGNSLWWFYGYTGKRREGDMPELILVEVWKTPHTLTYVGQGQFMYNKQDTEYGAVGKWKRADMPLLPPLELGESNVHQVPS